ncbi:MAG TPA: X-Pro aminopeptidase [Alphaproteobacteria bacterium]|nr:X-Pro aminopeptidase [Alphaproteobacteria bacterium]HCY47869.1 X-Pro aminopeptidase [Alphaproteobacteria bacterium]
MTYQQIEPPIPSHDKLARIALLRDWLIANKFDGLLINHDDESLGEYLQARDERLCWATGFSGSSGLALVTPTGGHVITDGRYHLQAATEVAGCGLEVLDHAEDITALNDLPQRARIAAWPQQFPVKSWAYWEEKTGKAGHVLEQIATHPVDDVWQDRPPRKNSTPRPHDLALAGQTSAEKLQHLRSWLLNHELDGFVTTDATCICWLANIRGADLPHTPVIQSALLVTRDDAVISLEGRERAGLLQSLLHDAFSVRDDGLLGITKQVKNAVAYDPAKTSAGMLQALRNHGCQPTPKPCPISAQKMIKNDAEQAGMREAHRRDGLAMVRFLSALDKMPPKDELEIVIRLEESRRLSDKLLDISFDTISGLDEHGAVIHYRVSRESNKAVAANGSLLLLDSGGQYTDGTTDITRTIWVGNASPGRRMIENHTLVLKAHIALAQCRFPVGTNGIQLDAITRAPLWMAGKDFAHGTGHGVGAALSVHEGPCGIHKRATTPLAPGMILSNEPGYYEAGSHGIRIENLVLVVADGDTLGLETLTLAPIDLRLVAKDMLTDHECAWLNKYHQHVWDILHPDLDDHHASWLKKATAAI